METLFFTNYTGPSRTKVTQAHAGLKEKGVFGHSEEKGRTKAYLENQMQKVWNYIITHDALGKEV